MDDTGSGKPEKLCFTGGLCKGDEWLSQVFWRLDGLPGIWKSNSELNVTVSNNQIEQVNAQKLLRVKIDAQLNFNEHIDDICKKLSQRIGVLKTIKRNLPMEERKLFYNAMIKPVMLHGCCIWSTTSCENIDRVFKLQKRAARIILNADMSERSARLFETLEWMPLSEEIELQKCCVIYKSVVGESPSYMNQIFTRNSEMHSRATRHSNFNLVCNFN